MKEDFPYIHRDLSWLSFNYRVLQEAKDPRVPLFERLKFMAIYSSNLGEYFQVRIGQLKNLIRLTKREKKELEFDPNEILKKVLKIVNKQQEEYSSIFEDQILPELKKHRIHLLKRKDLNAEQKEFVEGFFNRYMLPYVQPVLLVKKKIRPFLNNGALYLALFMVTKGDKNEAPRYAIVKIPSDHLPRFIHLPESNPNRRELIMLDDIVRHNVSFLFPGFDIQDTYSIKLTRDAELYIEDEFSGDLIEKIRSSLAKRHVGPASRLVYDREMPEDLLQFLMETFDLENYDLLPEGRYHNNFDFFKFPDFGMTHLKNKPLPSLPYTPLEKADDLFASIRKKDHLIHVPYHEYESVIRFFEEAADDPQVTHIKIVQYRVAEESRIMEALMKSVRRGKRVSVFVEVKARFDEEANLIWGERLERAGVNVNYSFPGLKVHSKIALILRQEKEGNRFYAYLSTGNFHEGTVKIYSDFGMFTADDRLTREVARVFSFLETATTPVHQFEHLLVGQYNLRADLEKLIDRETENAQAGKPAGIILKMNSLQDPKMIKKLYLASQAGVPIILIIRGICSLIPGVKKISENIQVRSIVDRYLEHSRVFVFRNGGQEKIYLSSADWMVRNLSRRVEVAFPIYNPSLKEEIKETLLIQLSDNMKSRIIEKNQENPYFKNQSDLNVRSQLETYYYLKRKME